MFQQPTCLYQITRQSFSSADSIDAIEALLDGDQGTRLANCQVAHLGCAIYCRICLLALIPSNCLLPPDALKAKIRDRVNTRLNVPATFVEEQRASAKVSVRQLTVKQRRKESYAPPDLASQEKLDAIASIMAS